MNIENKFKVDYYHYNGITKANKFEWVYDSYNFYFINPLNYTIKAKDRIEAYEEMLALKNKRNEIIKNKITNLIDIFIIHYFNELDITSSIIFNTVKDITDKNELKNALLLRFSSYTRNEVDLIKIDSMMEDIIVDEINKANIIELINIDKLELITKFIIPLQEKILERAKEYINEWLN